MMYGNELIVMDKMINQKVQINKSTIFDIMKLTLCYYVVLVLVA